MWILWVIFTVFDKILMDNNIVYDYNILIIKWLTIYYSNSNGKIHVYVLV